MAVSAICLVQGTLSLASAAHTNFVIGVNGAGKSSIVSALCLGLGGSTSDMEKSTELAPFVKTGTSEAIIEVVLQGFPGSGDYRIERTIKILPGTSKARTSWALNGEPSSEDAINGLMSLLSIQMDNPCMFLPQERISAFTRQGGRELLVSTMRSLGGDINARYERLLKTKKVLDKLRVDVERTEKESADADTVVKRLEYYKAAAEALAQAKKWITVMNLRLPAAEAAELNAKCKELQADLETKQQKLAAIADDALAKNAAVEAEAAFAAAGKTHAAARRAAQAACEPVTKLSASLTDSMANEQEIKESINKTKKSSSDGQDLVEKARAKLAKAEADLSKLMGGRTDASFSSELAEARAAKDAATNRHQDVKRRRDAAAVTEAETRDRAAAAAKAAASVVDVTKMKLERMKTISFDGAVTAYYANQWIEANRSKFKSDVYGPLCIYISPKRVEGIDPMIVGRAIENLIPANIRFGFVTTSDHDRSLLAAQKFRRRGAGMGNVTVFEVRPDAIAGQLQRFEQSRPLHGPALQALEQTVGSRVFYLADLVQADDAAHVVLARESRVDLMLVAAGTNSTTGAARATGSNMVPAGSILATHDAIFRVKKSSYGGENFLQRTEMRREVELMNIVVSDRDAGAAKGEAEACAAAAKLAADRLEAAKSEFAVSQRELTAADQRFSALDAARKARVAAEGLVRSEKKALESATRAAQDLKEIPVEVARLLAELRDSQAKTAALTRAAPALAAAVVEANVASWAAALDLDTAKTAARDAKAAAEEATAARRELRRQVDAAERKLSAAAAAAATADKAASTAATKVANAFSTFVAQFEALPLDKAELDAMIEAEQERIEAAVVNDEFVRDYDGAKEAQERLRKLKAKLLKEQSELGDEYLHKLASWQDELTAKINIINKRFQLGMARIQCRGTVELVTSADDIAAVRLVVRVEFRAGAGLNPLSPDYQSGGERAVSTMLLLLAMQHVAPLPFRILDEINQGMDIKNERSVMEELLDAVAVMEGGGTGGSVAQAVRGRQLFIVSPKLMPDMVHHPMMRTCIVMNGPMCGHGPKDAAAIQGTFTQIDFMAIARDFVTARVSELKRDERLAQAWKVKATDADAVAAPRGGSAIAGRRATAVGSDDEDDSDSVQIESQPAVAVPRRRQRTVSDDDDESYSAGVGSTNKKVRR